MLSPTWRRCHRRRQLEKKQEKILRIIQYTSCILPAKRTNSYTARVLCTRLRAEPPPPGLENEEDDNLFEQLGISRSVVETYTTKDGLPKAAGVAAGGAAGADADGRDPSDATAASAAEVAAATATATAVAAAAAEAGGAPVLSADPRAGGAAPVDAVDAQVVEVGEEVVAAAEEAASAADDEAKSLALAAAAALEAAVASGDVVYPKNADKEEGDGGEGGGPAGEAGEELAASIGSTEVF